MLRLLGTVAGFIAVCCGGTTNGKTGSTGETPGAGNTDAGSSGAGGALVETGGRSSAGGAYGVGGSAIRGGAPPTGGSRAAGGATVTAGGNTAAGGTVATGGLPGCECPRYLACPPGTTLVIAPGPCSCASCMSLGAGGASTGGRPSRDGGFPACCSSDIECGDDPSLHCVNTRCLYSESDRCWRDGDCGDGEQCSGVRICPCNADCDYDAVPGTCVPSGCCLTDFECGDIYHVPCVNGVCMTPNPQNCWSDTECAAGTHCVGSFVCPCKSFCPKPNTPGLCQ
jgi:hypothetical protein